MPLLYHGKKKMPKKIKQMTMVRTFQACETIVQTATVKGDEDIILLLRVTKAQTNPDITKLAVPPTLAKTICIMTGGKKHLMT